MDQLQPYPRTQAGRYRRKMTDELEAISGLKYCTSCSKLRPVGDVKIYRGNNGVGVPRCNECQARRAAHMKKRLR